MRRGSEFVRAGRLDRLALLTLSVAPVAAAATREHPRPAKAIASRGRRLRR